MHQRITKSARRKNLQEWDMQGITRASLVSTTTPHVGCLRLRPLCLHPSIDTISRKSKTTKRNRASDSSSRSSQQYNLYTSFPVFVRERSHLDRQCVKSTPRHYIHRSSTIAMSSNNGAYSLADQVQRYANAKESQNARYLDIENSVYNEEAVSSLKGTTCAH